MKSTRLTEQKPAMPEGHKIHRLALDHGADFVGMRLQVSSPQGRFADGAAVLNRRKLNEVWAYGKHLFYEFTAGYRLHVHLGRYGRVRTWHVPAPTPEGQVRLRVAGDQKGFDLRGPTACELLSEKAVEAILNRLGPDPLRPDADPQRAWQRIRRSRTPIGTLLLNQSVIAGVGNIFRADALFAMGLHPERPGKSMVADEFEQLWKWLVRTMRVSVRHNRIITADPKRVGTPRSKMNDEQRLLVYKRSRCSACGHKVDLWLLGGRKMYACPKCQRW
jgi:endonuclease-8